MCGLPVWVGGSDAEFLAEIAGEEPPMPECWNFCDVPWAKYILRGRLSERAVADLLIKRLPLNQSEPHIQIYKNYELADRKHSYGTDRMVVYTAPQGWPDGTS